MPLTIIYRHVKREQYQELFELLCSVDRLESYDVTSTLGWLVDALRCALLGNSFKHLGPYLAHTGPSRLPRVLASLPNDTLTTLIQHHLQAKDYCLVLEQALLQCLSNGLANDAVAKSATILFKSRITDNEVSAQLIAQLEMLARGQQVQPVLFLLAWRCDEVMVRSLSWENVTVMKLVHVTSLMGAAESQALVSMAPKSKLLTLSVCSCTVW
jgi:hypothetical protein